MGRSASVRIAIFLLSILLLLGLPGCGGGSSKPPQDFPTPANITLNPTPTTALEVGKTLTIVGAPKDAGGNAITTPLTYLSSNPAVLTIATVTVSSGVTTGFACAGSWDSLTNPQICTPGPSGTVQITATSNGVVSPPTTVYVHQHIDAISIQPAPGQLAAPSCFSLGRDFAGQTFNFQAVATNQGNDITSTVGPFTWSQTNVNVATLTTPTTLTSLPNNQVQIAPKTPGITRLTATLGDNTSAPLDYITCPVQSIKLSLTQPVVDPTTGLCGSAGNVTPITNPTQLQVSTFTSLYAEVCDTANERLVNVPLTWTASNTLVLGASTTVSSFVGGQATASATAVPGGSSVIASCAPPTCNIGFTAPGLVYPQDVAAFVVLPSTSTARQSTTVWASSTACGTTSNCIAAAIPISTPTTSTGSSTVGTPVQLPATPNSMVFDRQGNNIFLGTDRNLSNTKGVMVLSGNTVTQSPPTAGKVLAVSPDGKKVILSDTVDTPNLVYVFDSASHTSVTMPITGATAAGFSADSLRAFIVAGTTLYVYSTQWALQSTANLGGPVNDVSFLSIGSLAYLSGGTGSGITEWTTNQNFSNATAPLQTTSLPETPTFLQGLPDSCRLISAHSSGVDLIDVANAPATCQTTSGGVASFNLGQGAFTPTQMLVAGDGKRAYILGKDGNARPLASVLVLNIGTPSTTSTSSSIALANNASPLRAALETSGGFLYVGADDGAVHVIDTTLGADVEQITFTKSFCQDSLGNPASVTPCNPDLIVVKP